MRRRLAAGMVAALIGVAVAVFAPASPASATSVCVAAGTTAAVTPGLLYPIGLPLVLVDVLGQTTVTWNNELQTASWGIGGLICPINGKTGASGTLKGYCGHSTGTGTIGSHKVEWTSLGSFLVLTNGLVGIVNAIPDATIGGNTCLHTGDVTVQGTTLNTGNLTTGGALTFLVTGVGVKTNCGTTVVPLQSSLLTNLDLQQTVLNSTIHITTPAVPNIHIRYHVCVPVKL